MQIVQVGNVRDFGSKKIELLAGLFPFTNFCEEECIIIAAIGVVGALEKVAFVVDNRFIMLLGFLIKES